MAKGKKKMVLIIAIVILLIIGSYFAFKSLRKKQQKIDENVGKGETGDDFNYNSCRSDTAGRNPHLFPVRPIANIIKIYGYVDTCGGNLNFRSKPSTDSNVLDSIPNNTKINIIYAKPKEWYAAKYNGKEGFVHSSFIKDIATGNASVDNNDTRAFYNNYEKENVNKMSDENLLKMSYAVESPYYDIPHLMYNV